MERKKRVALLSIRAFLFQNGIRFVPDQIDAVTTIEGLAAGTIDESMLVDWIESNSSELRDRPGE